jgi:hypothetical protein
MFRQKSLPLGVKLRGKRMRRFAVLLFMASLAFGQSLKIQRQELNLPNDETEWAFPHFMSDDKELLLTTPNYRGLWRYSIENETITQISNDEGAGYQPLFLDENRLLFRLTLRHSPQKIAPLQYQIYELNLGNGSLQPRSEKGRELQLISQHTGYVIQNGKSFQYHSLTNQSEPWMLIDTKTDAIRIGRGDEMRELQPKGEGHYLWASLSPAADEILFTYAGKGTYLCDLNGAITDSLAHLNAPVWSADGRFIVGMADEDDGHVITRSELWLLERSSLQRHQLTETPAIHEMYPVFNQDASRIAFHTTEGKIGLLELVWEGGDQ